MEFTCSVHTAKKFEAICDKLVTDGLAVRVHTSVKKDGKEDTTGFSTSKYEMGFGYREVDFDIKVKVRPDPSNFQFGDIVKVPVRFWYEGRKENGEGGIPYERRAGIKITDEGLMLIGKSMKVLALLQKAGFKVSAGGAIDLDNIIQRLNLIADSKQAVEKP